MAFEGDGSVLSPVLAHPPVGVLLVGLIGGRMISDDGLSNAVVTQPDDIHNLLSHWKDTKPEPSGIAFAHLEVPASIAAARPEDMIRRPMECIIGENTGAAILESEMAKLDACRMITCYDDRDGQARLEL